MPSGATAMPLTPVVPTSSPTTTSAGDIGQASPAERRLQGRHGELEPVGVGEERILVLDRQRSVVAGSRESDEEASPELDGMPGTDRAEDPASLGCTVARD